VLLCATGVALVAAAPGAAAQAAALLPVAAMVLGVGYGPITPASSQVLARTAPPSRMALTFSLKQTGVPAGAALAGAGLPALALALGWRPALLLVAALGILVVVVAQPARRSLDADRRPARPLSLVGVFAPLRVVFGSRALSGLSLAGFIYAATQVCLTSFLVVYLTESLRVSLVHAGLALTVANAGGIAGRIGWGAVADRFVPPRRLLGVLGILSCLCAGTTATFDADTLPALVLATCALFGTTAIGWNGVQLAELARHAPKGAEGAITGASGFLTFSGVVVGPPLFALLATLTGGYRAGFVACGVVSGLCGGYFLLSKNK
jgi:MFS family permease